MNKYKQTYSVGYENQKKRGDRNPNPTHRWYSKEFINQVLASIDSMKAMKLEWKEIWENLKTLYGLTGKHWNRWEDLYSTYKGNKKIEYKLDVPQSIDILAKLMNKKDIQAKLNIKQRNILNSELNVQAFRQMIINEIKEHRWFTDNITKPIKRIIDKSQAVYIISDEHYRGLIDKEQLNCIYDKIEQDIKENKYKNIELWYLGDGIDGLIHLPQLQSNDGAVKPAIQYANILVNRINRIKQVSSIKFVVESNHNQTRTLSTTKNQLAKEDLSYTILALLEMGLRKDIKIVANWEIVCEYNGKTIVLLHGHQDFAIKKEKLISTWASNHKINPDMYCLGHYHEYKAHKYGKDSWLFVAPATKVWNGDYEKNKGYVSQGLITKLVYIDNQPVFTPISVERS